MVKNNEQEKTVKTGGKALKTAAIRLVMIAVLAAAGYGLWKNPQLVEKINTALHSGEPAPSTVGYQGQIDLLNSRLEALQMQFNELAQQKLSIDNEVTENLQARMNAIEKTNLNVIDSKADVATVLGLLTRLDKQEAKLDKLAKVTDESALILTATMLVKDSAERGGRFEYEAEVLQQTAADMPQMQEPLAVIARYAAEGIVSQEQLTKEFGRIYKGMLKRQKAEYEQGWKERFNAKLSEFVQIKRVDEKAPAFAADAGLEAIKTAVDNGNLKSAVRELEQPANVELLKNRKLAEWLRQAKANTEFNDAVKRISASSLAIMKVNFLRNKTN